MSKITEHAQVSTLIIVDRFSPSAARWLNKPADERGDITAQNAIWMGIAAAGAFAVAVILYNKFKTKATDLDLSNPGQLPTG